MDLPPKIYGIQKKIARIRWDNGQLFGIYIEDLLGQSVLFSGIFWDIQQIFGIYTNILRIWDIFEDIWDIFSGFFLNLHPEDASGLGGAVPAVNGYVCAWWFKSHIMSYTPSYGGCYHSHTNYPLVN